MRGEKEGAGGGRDGSADWEAAAGRWACRRVLYGWEPASLA